MSLKSLKYNRPSETLSSGSIQSTLSDTWRIVRLYPNNILPPSPPTPLSIVASTNSVYFDIHIHSKNIKQNIITIDKKKGFQRFHTGKDVGPVTPFRFYERYKTKKKKLSGK